MIKYSLKGLNRGEILMSVMREITGLKYFLKITHLSQFESFSKYRQQQCMIQKYALSG